MQHISRRIEKLIESQMFSGKAIILTGARQTGKSTLFSDIQNASGKRTLSLNCDEPNVRAMLTDASLARLNLIVGNSEIVLIDEAQQVSGIGMVLKRLVDNFNHVQFMVTGSSSLDIHNALEEPLTGRKWEYNLFPVSTGELYDTSGYLDASSLLEFRLVYGSYPEIIINQADAKERLMNLSSSYLYKDLLSDDNVRKPVLLEKILVALALQVGHEVSYNELAQTVGSDRKTIEKYVDLLEKCFVIFRLPALNRNVRSELKKGKKIYFYDNGIRNAILQNFAPLSMRQDTGALWGNFFISERIKHNHYRRNYAKLYFWRTHEGREVDFVEEKDGRFRLFEMKYSPSKSNVKAPELFLSNYDVESFDVISPKNYLEHLI